MSDAQVMSAQPVAPATGEKRGRGRPRKDPSTTMAEKKANGTKGKPGRKPGSKNKPKPQSVETPKKVANAQAGEKRGRGRPRKDEAAKVAPKPKPKAQAQPAAPGEKRGRGRPRKVITDATNTSAAQNNAE